MGNGSVGGSSGALLEDQDAKGAKIIDDVYDKRASQPFYELYCLRNNNVIN